MLALEVSRVVDSYIHITFLAVQLPAQPVDHIRNSTLTLSGQHH